MCTCKTSGPDAVKAANWIFSADVDKAPGSVIYTCMLNARGGVEGDLTVTVVEPGDGRPHTPEFGGERGFYVAVGGGAAQQGLDHMRKVIERVSESASKRETNKREN